MIEPDSLCLSEYFALQNLWTQNERLTNYRFGMICSTLANINRDPKKQRKPFTPEDFFPSPDSRDHQTPEQQLIIMENIMMTVNRHHDPK